MNIRPYHRLSPEERALRDSKIIMLNTELWLSPALLAKRFGMSPRQVTKICSVSPDFKNKVYERYTDAE